MLREELGWDIEPQNIALTNGQSGARFSTCLTFSQDRRADGIYQKVLFLLALEYIGYADSGLKRICPSPRA